MLIVIPENISKNISENICENISENKIQLLWNLENYNIGKLYHQRNY